jgi:hypothetical protein
MEMITSIGAARVQCTSSHKNVKEKIIGISNSTLSMGILKANE